MHPPAHVCRQLYEIAPSLRLAWWGENPNSPDGASFTLLELQPWRSVVINDQVQTIRRLWPMEVVGAGPVFNRWGGTRPDYDSVTQALVEQTPLDPRMGYELADIFGSRFLQIVRKSMMRQADADRRRRRRLEKMGQERAQKITDTADEIADKAKYMPDDGWRPQVEAYKFKKDRLARFEATGEKAREQNQKAFLRRQGFES